MIAAAMNTRPQEALSYRDLARQQARISRRVSLDALPRLEELVEASESAAAEGDRAGFDVVLQFSIDGRGFSRVEGGLSGQIALNCNGCAESLTHTLELNFACVIAESEAVAAGLVENSRSAGEAQLVEDLLVANGTEVTVAQIVEDEILLNLPERLCTSNPCERAPILAYPAEGEETAAVTAASETEQTGEENPFSVLAELKSGGGRTDD